MAWHVVRHTTSGRLTELANELSADLEKVPDPAALGKGNGGKARTGAITLEEAETSVEATEKMGKRYEYLSSQVAAVQGKIVVVRMIMAKQGADFRRQRRSAARLRRAASRALAIWSGSVVLTPPEDKHAWAALAMAVDAEGACGAEEGEDAEGEESEPG